MFSREGHRVVQIKGVHLPRRSSNNTETEQNFFFFLISEHIFIITIFNSSDNARITKRGGEITRMSAQTSDSFHEKRTNTHTSMQTWTADTQAHTAVHGTEKTLTKQKEGEGL